MLPGVVSAASRASAISSAFTGLFPLTGIRPGSRLTRYISITLAVVGQGQDDVRGAGVRDQPRPRPASQGEEVADLLLRPPDPCRLHVDRVHRLGQVERHDQRRFVLDEGRLLPNPRPGPPAPRSPARSTAGPRRSAGATAGARGGGRGAAAGGARSRFAICAPCGTRAASGPTGRPRERSPTATWGAAGGSPRNRACSRTPSPGHGPGVATGVRVNAFRRRPTRAASR